METDALVSYPNQTKPNTTDRQTTYDEWAREGGGRREEIRAGGGSH